MKACFLTEALPEFLRTLHLLKISYDETKYDKKLYFYVYSGKSVMVRNIPKLNLEVS